MLSSFARRTVTRRRYPTGTDQGVEAIDYSGAPTDVTVQGCWYEPTSSSEDLDGRDAVGTGYTVATPPGSGFLATDHVVIEGAEHELVGAPLNIPSPTGALDSVKFVTRRWEG